MFWLDFGGCDSSTTLFISPQSFLLSTSWIDMRLGESPPLVSQEPILSISAQSDDEIEVIGLPLRVSNVVINGSEGTWYYIEL